jgi:uncharacterized protein involved in exopolysaccharide biosynthesis
MLMRREYTANVRVVIEPPAGTDLRSAMAVSPIYLESLRTYEQFAASDRLFSSAVEQFHLRAFYPGMPVESLKQRVLKVQILRNTRILELSTTLPDPVQAQKLAQFLAESTVALNRSIVTESDRDLVTGFEAQSREVHAQLDRLDSEWARETVDKPVYNLRAALDQDESLLRDLQSRRLTAESGSGAQASLVRQNGDASERLQRQIDELKRSSAEREKELAARQAHLERLATERLAVQNSLAAIEARLREARGDQGYRGERLKIIDSGVVPEKPSSPNVPLNVAVALLLGLLLPAGYFTLEMHFRAETAAESLPFRTYARIPHD